MLYDLHDLHDLHELHDAFFIHLLFSVWFSKMLSAGRQEGVVSSFAKEGYPSYAAVAIVSAQHQQYPSDATLSVRAVDCASVRDNGGLFWSAFHLVLLCHDCMPQRR